MDMTQITRFEVCTLLSSGSVRYPARIKGRYSIPQVRNKCRPGAKPDHKARSEEWKAHY